MGQQRLRCRWRIYSNSIYLLKLKQKTVVSLFFYFWTLLNYLFSHLILSSLGLFRFLMIFFIFLLFFDWWITNLWMGWFENEGGERRLSSFNFRLGSDVREENFNWKIKNKWIRCLMVAFTIVIVKNLNSPEEELTL